MPEPNLAASPPAATPAPRRQRRWLFLVALLLLAGAGAGLFFFTSDPSEQELREAVAEADRLDPYWRFEELEARRENLRDEQNAALPVLAARKQLPATWPPAPPAFAGDGPGPFPPGVEERLADLPPEVQLDEALARDLKEDLANNFEPALVEARKLKGLSRGRFLVAWTPGVIGSMLSSQESRPVASLLVWEATAQAHDGKAGEALATARGVLVAGRSIGDEPVLISLLFRLAIRAQAVRSIERTLAQGTPPPAELKAAQELFGDEEAQPVFLNGVRGERAATQQAFAAGVSGAPTQALGSGKGGVRRLLDFAAPRRTRDLQARALRVETACVEVAKLPLEEQGAQFVRLKPAGSVDGLDHVETLTMSLIQMGESYRRSQAILRCAIVGLALERYRAEQGRWPGRLEELKQEYLKAVPLDPFDGKPLRYKRLPDGVLVYSVGPDGQDDGGALNRKDIRAKGTDLGFRLWDADKRRQPPAEVLPPPEELGS